MYKTELKYGVIIGIGMCAWIILEFLLGFHTTRMEWGLYSGYFSVLIPIIALQIGIRKKRDLDLKGKMTYREGFTSGMIMVLIAASIITGFFFIYNKFINPHWMENGLAFNRLQMEKGGFNETTINERVASLEKLYTLPYQMMSAFFGVLFQGLILVAVMTAFIKTPKE